MTRAGVALALLALVVLAGCRTTKTVYVPVERTREVIKTKVDTVIQVKVERPTLADSSKLVKGVADSVRDALNTEPSVLENDVARSTAQILGGRLLHNLEFLGDPIPWQFEADVTEIRDSIPYPVEVEKIVEVRKALRWWEVTLQVMGVLFIILLALLFGARYLKPKP